MGISTRKTILNKQLKAKRLQLGCGFQKISDSIGIDINPRSHADIIHNLDAFPYPFKDNQFEQIIAINILEHLTNLNLVMEELHRIMKPGAKLYIETSHFSSVDSFTDPTHKHFTTTRTFDYYCPGTDLYKYQYTRAKFKKNYVYLGDRTTQNVFFKATFSFINAHQIWYEKRFAFLFPVGTITIELIAIKP